MWRIASGCSRRAFRMVALALTMALIPSIAQTRRLDALATTHGVANTLVPPRHGTLFGAYAGASGAQNPSTFMALEHKVDRRLVINRSYYLWNTLLLNRQVKWDLSRGVIPLVSVDPMTARRQKIPWSSIARGTYDVRIKTQAKALASLKSPVLLSFAHEPELSVGSGTPGQFVAAWRHYVAIFRKNGAANVSFVLILQASTYNKASIRQWYPGDSYVNWVGADGYNVFGCRPGARLWQSFRTIFSGLNLFAIAHHKPAVVAEWASTEDPHERCRKAYWIAAAARTIRSWHHVKAVSYFDGKGKAANCEWPVTSSASALKAFRSMGSWPYFEPHRRQALRRRESVMTDYHRLDTPDG